MIEQILQTLGVEFLIAQQIYDDAGVEVAGARPHGNTASRSQPHRGIDGYPVAKRAETRSITQMREDGSFGKRCAEAMHQRLVRHAVKTIAADAFVEIAPRERKIGCTFR